MWTLPDKPKRLVGEELVHDAVARGDESDGQHHTEGNQFGWDPLEGAQALGDGVAYERPLVLCRLCVDGSVWD